MKSIIKNALLFIIGGFLYISIEILWRFLTNGTHTHFAMFIIGGIVFLILGGLNDWLTWDMTLLCQCVIGTVVVLVIEFISGYMLNIRLGLGVWDYSKMPMNLLGQICPQFALAWFILSGVGIIVDDWLRYLLFHEEYPHYTLF